MEKGIGHTEKIILHVGGMGEGHFEMIGQQAGVVGWLGVACCNTIAATHNSNYVNNTS